MSTMGELFQYIWDNKTWLFDGVGLAIVSSVFAFLFWFFRRAVDARSPASPAPAPAKPRDRARRAPEIEFADGIHAGVALTIDLHLEEIFLLLRRYKDWQALLDDFTPRIHIRLTQVMEAFPYEEARQRRPAFEKQLKAEFEPQFAEYGVRLMHIGIGKFVTFDPRFERLGDV
ncbi:MAG: hypothetical protein ABIO86_13520 [Sphingomonas sp.]